MDLLVNLRSCLRQGDGKQLGMDNARDGRTLSQSEKDWEKSSCVSTKLAKTIVKKLHIKAKSATVTAVSPTHILFLQGLCSSQYIDGRLVKATERILDPMHQNILPQIDDMVT